MTSVVIPTLRYRDAPAAIDFLVEAFGFERDLVVRDVDGHAARAADAGAEIVMPPRDEDHGGRSYTCRDPEGNVWSFGSYDPWLD